MKEHVLRFIGAVFLTILALLGICAVLHILVTLPLGEKGPEWLGAIGTVATFIGTIWLAMSSERKRRREEHDLAIIAAAQFVVWIPRMQFSLGRAISQLAMAGPSNFSDVYKNAATLLTNAEIWQANDLRPLVHIPGHTAAKLSFVSAQIATMINQLNRHANRDAMSSNEIDMRGRNIENELRSFIEELQGPQNACLAFLELHGFKRN